MANKNTSRRAGSAAEDDPLHVWIDVDDNLHFAEKVLALLDIDALSRAGLLQRIKQIQDKSADGNLSLAVVGEFDSGKSTFINALLRQELLKASTLVSTAAATKLCYGNQLELQVLFKGEKSPLYYTRHANQIWRKIRALGVRVPEQHTSLQACINLVTADDTIVAYISQVVLQYPASFLAEGITIIDTPGINSEHGSHMQVTQNVVENEADAAVIVIPAAFALSRTLTDFLAQQLRPFLHRCLFVVTQMDKIRPAERQSLLESLQKRLKNFLADGRPVEVYPASAQMVLDALEPGVAVTAEMTAWNDRFAKLEQSIWNRLRKERELSIAESLLRLLSHLFKELDDYLHKQQTSYEQRNAALQREIIPDIAAFSQGHLTSFQQGLSEAQDTLQERITELVNSYRGVTLDGMREAIYDAADNSSLSGVLTNASTALESIHKALAEQIQEVLGALLEAVETTCGELDDEFATAYQRLAAFGGEAVSFQPESTELNIYIDFSNTFSAARDLNAEFDSQAFKKGMGGAAAGAAAGLFLGPIGAIIGAGIGAAIGSNMGPSLSERKDSIWSQARPALTDTFDVAQRSALAALYRCTREATQAFEGRSTTYVTRYRDQVDRLRAQQQREGQQLALLHQNIKDNLDEINRRRSSLEQKQRHLASITVQ